MGVESGDEVIVPAVSFVATVGAVLRTGAVPVVVISIQLYVAADTMKRPGCDGLTAGVTIIAAGVKRSPKTPKGPARDNSR